MNPKDERVYGTCSISGCMAPLHHARSTRCPSCQEDYERHRKRLSARIKRKTDPKYIAAMNSFLYG